MWCRATRRGRVCICMLGGTRRVGRTRRGSGIPAALATLTVAEAGEAAEVGITEAGAAEVVVGAILVSFQEEIQSIVEAEGVEVEVQGDAMLAGGMELVRCHVRVQRVAHLGLLRVMVMLSAYMPCNGFKSIGQRRITSSTSF